MRKVWNIILVLVIFWSCNNIPSYSVSTRPSYVNIGAIMCFNSTIGKVAKVAIEASVDDINASQTILNGTMLNISMQDTKFSVGFLGIIECMYALLKHIFLLITWNYVLHRLNSSLRLKMHKIPLILNLIYEL